MIIEGGIWAYKLEHALTPASVRILVFIIIISIFLITNTQYLLDTTQNPQNDNVFLAVGILPQKLSPQVNDLRRWKFRFPQKENFRPLCPLCRHPVESFGFRE